VDLSFSDLLGDFDAVFLGIGLGVPRRLGLPGEELDGVRDALTFIEELRQAKDKRSLGVGANVIVIGGGNTAVDAAIQAKRLGAENVVMAYRRGRDNMSATAWERRFAQTSGVIIKDWTEPVAFVGAKSVTKAVFRHSRSNKNALPGSRETFEMPADLVLLAVGQELSPLFQALRSDGGKLWVDKNYQTSLPRVFAGGDCIRSGDDLTVQAVEDGKRAALCADAILRSEPTASKASAVRSE
jgi:glutamate synthase (NADPH/NADH) small chain